MIIFYRHKKCALCDEVHEQLIELVVAHTVKQLPVTASAEDHCFFENNKTFRGEAAIKSYLGELTQLLHDWRKFQSDSCYTGDDGRVC